MALMCSVMAWGETHTAGTYDALQDALAAAANGDVIELTADIAYPASPTRSDLININKSITLDGKGHSITGYGFCNYRLDDKATFQPTHIAINANHDKSGLNVTIKNLKLNKNVKKYALNGEGSQAVAGCPTSSERYYGIGVFDGVTKLTLEKDTFTTSIGGNAQVICATGTSSTPLKLVMNQVKIDATLGSGYATYFLKPIDLEMNNSYMKGFCALYFKPNLEPFDVGNYPRKFWYGIDNYGSKGSVAVLNNCTLDSKNPHSTESNGFGVLAMEEGDINITLNNCDLDAQSLGSSSQALFLLSDWAPLVNRSSNNVLTLTGDNTHINGNLVNACWYALVVDEGEHDLYENGYNEGTKSKQSDPFSAFSGDIQVIMTGGTYNFDPRTYTYDMHVSTEDPHYADGAAKPTVFTQKGITIPAGYTVEELTQDEFTLYRVIADIQTSYNINQDVEDEGAGDNPNTSFIVQETTELVNNATEANYVQVKDNGGVQTTLTIGTATNDQKLTVNSGMDVQDNAQVIIKSGSALVVENGGIISAQPENIVVEADENGAASLLLAPTVTVNQTPNLTVKMTAKNVGKVGADYYWHRFALPVDGITALPRDPARDTKLFTWNYAAEDWASISALTDMQPFYGYTLSTTHDGLEDVVYTFKGHLVGNVNESLNLTSQGYNFFGNSYTGYISIAALVDQLMAHADIDAAIWVWDTNNQTYKVVTLGGLKAAIEGGYVNAMYPKWQQEIAPMQTFILRLPNTTSAATEVDYASAIWGNPRYGNTPASAPARRQAIEGTIIRMAVTADNGMSDDILFMENDNYSDSFEKGFDGTKFMNEDAINMYASVEGENYGAVATDNLTGKTLTIQTTNDVNYTLSFDAVLGEGEYAIRDNVTNQVITIEEGAIYEFAAQPNSVIEGRFEIVGRANAPTAIENTEVKANVKGIYTIMGQYLGENFDILPAGVYVVNGVKIVK